MNIPFSLSVIDADVINDIGAKPIMVDV